MASKHRRKCCWRIVTIFANRNAQKQCKSWGALMSLGGHIATEKLQSTDSTSKTIFGVAISDLSREAAISQLLLAMQHAKPMKIAFCNAHTANFAWSDGSIRQLLSDFTVFADGVGVDIGAKLLHGAPFAANLNGTDFVPALIAAATRPLRIALFGARPGIAEKAAQVLKAHMPHHQFTAVSHGFTNEAETAVFLAGLQRQPVDILLVGMGNPHQEAWIARNISGEQATLALGVGALFDFLAGEVPRAPAWLRNLRLEWLYRLVQEPRRLFARYVLGNPLFLLRILLVKLGLVRFAPSTRGPGSA